MMSLFPDASIKEFKQAIFSDLGSFGFTTYGDFAVLDVSEEVRINVYIGGNAYFLSILISLTMPAAADALSKALRLQGVRERYNSGPIYNPIISVDYFHAVESASIKSAIGQANWPMLFELSSEISTDIEARSLALSNIDIESDHFSGGQLSDKQGAMLIIGLHRMNRMDLVEILRKRCFGNAEPDSEASPYAVAVDACIRGSLG
jgi:hypothetical protein